MIDAVILDLGGVVVNLDYELTVIELKKRVPGLDTATFYGKEAQLDFFTDYELGRISTDQLLAHFNRHYQTQLHLDEFKKAWNAMVLDFPASRIARVKKLAKQKRVFLLSNINALHADCALEAFAKADVGAESFHSIFEKVYYSHQTGMRKPHPNTFAHILKEKQLVAERTLFIDDSKHHVQGAATTGVHAVHLIKPKTLEQLLTELGF